MPRTFRVRGSDQPWALLREHTEFGIRDYDLLCPTSRFWSDAPHLKPDLIRSHVDSMRVMAEPSPTELLATLPQDDNWSAMTRRSVGRLFVWYLLAEDPERRLDARAVTSLAHQASLVRHVLQNANLKRVLIADEVGLGKTVEAGLIVQGLREQQPGLRVLYLAPARLVRNVAREFERLGLPARLWIAGPDRNADLTKDSLVIASIHRAVVAKQGETLFKEDVPAWDVVIVDECHHLSAYGVNGASAGRQFALVRELRKKISADGRLILMSGTPHQGHFERFNNLLDLLRHSDEKKDALRGRVIYRTKEDVRDWKGGPVFPQRVVNTPVVLDLGEPYRAWLRLIHELFEPGGNTRAQAGQRVAGWRCGQALQWATSSVEAGLGYLVRQAIRAGSKATDPGMREALAALRPYRRGPKNEDPGQLFERIKLEIGQQRKVGDVVDIEGDDDAPESAEEDWRPDFRQVSEALRSGLALLERTRDVKWQFLKDHILVNAGSEKVVLFAQPIETVTALAGFLERQTGRRPALIVGAQSEAEREAEIQRFRDDPAVQFLVSSRAGGEGLNLQVARRLVHVDVPWNPMELEQRVGRVHRFMSRRTIIVDTLVVKDSRETHMYEVAREKLRQIAGALGGDAGRFEALFSRVMSLVPPEELQGLLTEKGTGPLSDESSHAISEMVRAGFENWEKFHHDYAEQQQQIQALAPGQASWGDVAMFLEGHLDAKPATGFSALGFAWKDGEVVEALGDALVFRIDGKDLACGDYAGMPVTDAQGRIASQLGLNHEIVARKLRALALPAMPTGAAHLGWPGGIPFPVSDTVRPLGVLALTRQSIREGKYETGVECRVYVVSTDRGAREVMGPPKAALIRGLHRSTVRRDAELAPELVSRIGTEAERLLEYLRVPSESDRTTETRHAVFALFAGIVS